MIKLFSRLMSNSFLLISVIALSLSTLLASNLANAVPAFARQTDMPCVSCHYQSFPALNTFGRIFRANGYIMTGSQKKIEGDDISLPSTLNASIITKIRYEYKGDDNRGEVQWPDEAALLVGGRLSEDTGFLMELGMGPQEADTAGVAVDPNGNSMSDYDDPSLGGNGDGIIDPLESAAFNTAWQGDVEAAGDVTGNYLSTKFHFNVTDSLAVIPFSTDG
ncbi:MAG: hypothetical protein KAT90_09780, partial [Gammaproteobacteria bacterium]|nr:hypothetical protein [Gammaproteobacteria bacterium]